MMSLFDLLKRAKKAVSVTERQLRITDVIQQSAVSDIMRDNIDLWYLMYCNKSPWVHEWSPAKMTECKSLNLAATIARKKAEIATIEMKSAITSPKDQDGNETEATPRVQFLNGEYQDKIIKQSRKQLEFAVALGGMAIKPYPIQDSTTKKYSFGIDFIKANNFFPIAFDGSQKITKAAFVQQKIEGKKIYSRLEIHELNGNTATIINKAYEADNSLDNRTRSISDLGREIPLSRVPEWAAIAPEQKIQNVDRLLFAYLKMPSANNIDPNSPLGVSGFSRAVNLIQDADEQYSRLLWEFEGGELAIDADRDALTPVPYDDNGTTKLTYVLPKKQQRLMRRSNLDPNAGDMYEVFSPALRDDSLYHGLNIILRKIEDTVGLSAGTLSDPTDSVRTATELIINKQTTYITNRDIQMALKEALENVVYIMDVYCTLYNMVGDVTVSEDGATNFENISDYQVSFDFDDSILTDKTEEYAKDLQDYQNGIISRVELRMKRRGETRAQAEAALALIDQERLQAANERLMTEEENDTGN